MCKERILYSIIAIFKKDTEKLTNQNLRYNRSSIVFFKPFTQNFFILHNYKE